MIYLGSMLLLTLAGWSITGLLGGTRGQVERLGLSVLVGVGVSTVVAWGLDVVGVRVHPGVVLLVLAPAILDGGRRLWRGLDVDGAVRAWGRELRSPHPVVAVALLLLLLFLLGTIAGRTLILPNRFHDSITAFALLGKAIAHEGTYATDLFEHTRLARGGTYPPLAAYTFAWGETTGLAEPTAAMLVPVLGFVAWMFGAARRTLGATGALAVVVAAFLVPDLYGYVHLPLTNAFVAMYGAMALVYASTRAPRATALTVVAGILAAWSRADALALVAGSALAVALPGWRKTAPGPDPLVVDAARNRWGRRLGRAAAVLVPATLLLVLWSWWIEGVVGASVTGRLDLVPDWNPDRARYLLTEATGLAFNVWTMGIVMPAALVAVLSALVPAVRRRWGPTSPVFVRLSAGTVAALLLYTVFYYHVDPETQDPLAVLLGSSYRRGLTAFVVPLVLAVALSPAGTALRRALGPRLRRPQSAAGSGHHD
jgi:hypothetical protein